MIFSKALNKVTILSVCWIVAMVATGLVASIESTMGWMMVSVLALGPSAMLLHLAKELPRTTSQTIQEAQR